MDNTSLGGAGSVARTVRAFEPIRCVRARRLDKRVLVVFGIFDGFCLGRLYFKCISKRHR